MMRASVIPGSEIESRGHTKRKNFSIINFLQQITKLEQHRINSRNLLILQISQVSGKYLVNNRKKHAAQETNTRFTQKVKISENLKTTAFLLQNIIQQEQGVTILTFIGHFNESTDSLKQIKFLIKKIYQVGRGRMDLNLLTAIDVMDDFEKSRSCSLNFRLRLSVFPLELLLFDRYRSQPRIILP